MHKSQEPFKERLILSDSAHLEKKVISITWPSFNSCSLVLPKFVLTVEEMPAIRGHYVDFLSFKCTGMLLLGL